MSFLAVANSIQDSIPVELYAFTRGVETWRFASGAAEVEYLSSVYEPWPIKRTRIKQTEDMNKNVIEFTFPRSSTFAMYYIQYPSVQVTTVQIIRGFPGSGDYANWWKGRIIGARISKNEITIECESIFTALKRPGLRKLYEMTCCHTLYDLDCGVDRAEFARYVTITDITGKLITVSNMAGVEAGWFAGGMIVSNTLKRYYISIHDDDQFQIFLNPELEVGDEIIIYPGCDHLFTTCNNKFDNGLNYGGFPWMPDVNPYSGIALS